MNAPFKLGRIAPAVPGKRMELLDKVMATLPTPPAVVNDAAKALPCIGEMLQNQNLGDCTAACAFHVAGVLNDNAGRPTTFTDAEAIAFYSATSGYVPGDPNTDNGADEVTVLDYWQNNGLVTGAHKISAWTTINAATEIECKTAIWLFENAIGCACLPDEYLALMATMKNGTRWEVAGPPNPNNGHCFAIVGYTANYIIVSTWGMWILMSFAAFEKYCVVSAGGAAYTVLAQDALITATAKSPGGFDFTTLSGYLGSV